MTADANNPRRAAAMEIVRLHAGLGAAANFVPVPLLDSFMVSGVLLQMTESLATHYGADFERERAKAVLTAIGTGIAHEVLTHAPVARLAAGWTRALPVVGAPLRYLMWPALVAGYTYTLGKSYVDHYEAGGRFADFKPTGILQSPVAQVLA